jgi:hypothetical protein
MVDGADTHVRLSGAVKEVLVITEQQLINKLRNQKFTIQHLAEHFGVEQAEIIDLLKVLRHKNYLLHHLGDYWSITTEPPSQSNATIFKSDQHGCYTFGFIADNHLCSRYERLDILERLYDIFELEGITTVLNGGNWIDGEARFNVHDLHKHGLDNQLEYLVQHYPRRTGIKTFAVYGDDHEGWYAKREGIDIGDRAEQLMRKSGRQDWVNLGFLESYIQLEHSESGNVDYLLLMHPGGGTAYAISYTPQKIVESFTGGEKPGALLIGHYHKISYNIIREVHVIQMGCTQDQTPFMRKKKIPAHLGGGIVKFRQDPESGILFGCAVEFFKFQNKGFYNNRWTHSGRAMLPPASA